MKPIILLPCMGCEKVGGQLATLSAFKIEQRSKFSILLNPSLTQLAAHVIPEKRIPDATQPIIALNGCAIHCVDKILASNDLQPSLMISLPDLLDDIDIPKKVSSTLTLLDDPILENIVEKVESKLMQFVKEFESPNMTNASAGTPDIMEGFEFTPKFSYFLEFDYSKFHFSIPVNVDRLKFNWNDAWAYQLDDGKVVVGISDYLQKNLSDIIICEIYPIGTRVAQFDAIADVESSKTVNEVLTPFSGTIVATNPKLTENPEFINEDPHHTGWIAVINPSDYDSEKEDLMNSEQYFEFMKEKVEQEGVHT